MRRILIIEAAAAAIVAAAWIIFAICIVTGRITVAIVAN
jgi:hypothetical protein